MNEKTKKKNILDFQFQKYLIILSTTIILGFTYLIGVMIAIFTEQIKLEDFNIIVTLLVISIGILGTCAIFFFNATFHLKNIPEVIKSL